LARNLSRLVAGDPTLRMERNPETNQLVLWTMGEAHADVVLARLRAGGAEIDTEPVRVTLRQTFAARAKGHGRHVKQSGGHGQYAVCDIEVEPLPRGGGFEFVDKIVGGAIPNQYVLSVQKGVRAQMERGIQQGLPLVDLRVTLLDGKTHSVDSSDAAFQTAGALALREAAASGRRGRVMGTEAGAAGRTVVRAEVPAGELLRYAIDLRSMSSGTASFTRHFARYEPLPEALVAKA
jgi:elongation factor G